MGIVAANVIFTGRTAKIYYPRISDSNKRPRLEKMARGSIRVQNFVSPKTLQKNKQIKIFRTNFKTHQINFKINKACLNKIY
jgi:hypothetical protein